MDTTRRNVLKGAGAATGIAATGLGVTRFPRFSPVGRAQAIAPLVAVGLGVAGGYLVHEAVDYFTGESVDTAEFTALTNDEFHLDSYEAHLSMNGADDTVLTVLENRIADSQHLAWVKAKKAAVESFKLGDTEATATTAAQDAVTAYYKTIQTNLLNHWIEQKNKVLDLSSEAKSRDDTGLLGVYALSINGATIPGGDATSTNDEITSYYSYDVPLVDGTTQSVQEINMKTYDGSSTHKANFRPNAIDGIVPDYAWVQHPDFTDDVPLMTFGDGGYRFGDAWTQLVDKHSAMLTEVDTFVTNLYASSIDPATLDLTDFMDPSEIAYEYATASDGSDNLGYATATLASLNMLTNYDHTMRIRLLEDDITVNGQLFFDDPSLTIETGIQYNPEYIAGSVAIAYQYEDSDTGEMSSNFTELNQAFIVEAAWNNETGDPVETIETSDPIGQTSDVNVTQEELDKISTLANEIEDLQTKLLDEQSDTTSGGGGFDLSALSAFGLSGEAVAGVLALAGVGFLVKNSE